MHADNNASPAAVSEGAAASERRFREELKRIPRVNHEVYGTCLAPTYPTQLLIALAQFATAGIGAWRGQASVDWGLDPSLVRRYRLYHERRPGWERTWASLSCSPFCSITAPRPGCWTAPGTRSWRCGSPAGRNLRTMAC